MDYVKTHVCNFAQKNYMQSWKENKVGENTTSAHKRLISLIYK